MKKNLVFSAQEKFKDNINQNYYLDYYFYEKKKYSKFFYIEMDDFEDLDEKVIIKKRYLDSSYISFCNLLNKEIFEKKNFNITYWDIILKHWFEVFFDTYVQRYLTIEKILKDNEFDSVTLINNYYKHLETDYSNDIFDKCQNDNWNYCLLQFIFFNLNKNKNIKKNFIDINFESEIKPDKKKLKRNLLFFYNQIVKFLNLYNNSQSIFINSYLGIKKEVIFQLKLKQFPYILSDLLYNHIILSENYNNNLRNSISNKIENEEYDFFTKVFLKSVITFLPKSFLEGFNEIEYYQKRIFNNRNVKLIFTSSSHSFDDIFKRYMANEKKDFNTKLIIGQHGMGYPLEKKEIHPIIGEPRIELKFCDYYLMWGSFSSIKSNKFLNASVLFNRKYLNDYKKSNLNKNLIQFIQPHRESQNRMYNTKKVFLEFLDGLDYILSSLDKTIISNFFIKIHPYDYQNLIIKDLWLDKIIRGRVSSNIDKKFNIQKQKKINQKTKLFVFNYFSTGFLECISQNIPCIMLVSNKFDYFDDIVKDKIQSLIDCNIIFKNYDEFNYFLINNIEKIDKWWGKDTLQIKIKEFRALFARRHNNNDIFSIIKNIHEK